MFQQGRCWWTQSNAEMPLIRYTGGRLKLYRAESSDYFFAYHTCGPMRPTLETYNSTQPTILQLARKRKIIPCKKHNYRKKAYYRIKLHPPTNMSNKWFLQKDIANTPLAMFMASATSLDRMFMASNSVSTTVGFTGINTELFKYHNFTTPTTTGYHPQDTIYLCSYQQSSPAVTKITDIEIQNIIYLGNSDNYTQGVTIKDSNISASPFTSKLQTYTSSSGYWGNPFIPFYLIKPTGTLIYSKIHPSDWKNYYTTETAKLQTTHFDYLKIPTLKTYRYNPLGDTGINNKIYFTSITEVSSTWDPPRDTELQNNFLPLWIGLWGTIDFMKLLKGANIIDTQKVLTLHSDFIEPADPFVIPIDQDFLNGNSPYRPKDERTPSDSLNWHPKVGFQYRTVNNICAAGPGTIKLPPNVSAEAHIKFDFYFKLGGCSQEIKNIKDPEKFTSNNILQQPSLQSPETPFETYFYNFDWRRDFLTEKALNRVKKYTSPETPVIYPPGTNLWNPPPPQQDSSEGETEEEEKDKETLLRLLQQLRVKQRQYSQRILRLMQNAE